MPTGRRFTTLATILAMGAIVGVVACSSDSAVAPGNSVADSEIDQTVASDVGESFTDKVGQYQENESFEESLSSGSFTFMAGPSGAGSGPRSRTVTCGGPDASGWYSCIAYTARGLTITREVRFWSGDSYALGWGTGSVIDSTNHSWTKSGTFESAVKPGKMFFINESAAASMVVTHSTPALHTWNGAASVNDSSSYSVNNITRIFAYTAADTAAALTFTMPRSANPYPASGSISRNLTLHVTAGAFDKTITRFAKVTFDGSTIAVLQVGALTCSLDLVTGAVSGCH